MDGVKRTRLVTVVITLVLAATGAAVAAPLPIDADDLPRGADARVPYIVSNELHTAVGDLIELPATDGAYQLLGNTASGWAVRRRVYTAGGPDYELILVNDSEATTFHHTSVPYVEYESTWEHYQLSTNRYRVVEVLRREDYLMRVNVINLAGELVASRRFGFGDEVLDFSGPRLIVGGYGGTVSWRPGHAPKVIAKRRGNFADIAHDQVSLQAKDGRYGFTRLSNPGAPRWKAYFRPIRISPDGTKVYGMALEANGYDFRDVLQIRRLSDGHVLAAFKTFRLALDAMRNSAWEGSRAVVFKTNTTEPLGGVLVRCKVSGYCARASETSAAYQGWSLPLQKDWF